MEEHPPEQVELLRHLKDVHGIDAVYLEGMSDADVEEYRKLSGALARWKAPTGDDAIKYFGGETDSLCPFLGLNHSDAESEPVVPIGRNSFLARCRPDVSVATAPMAVTD